jgi:hypothetical protein
MPAQKLDKYREEAGDMEKGYAATLIGKDKPKSEARDQAMRQEILGAESDWDGSPDNGMTISVKMHI